MGFDLNKFGLTIKGIRTQLGMTQNDVFEKIGINTETLRRMENGKVIPKFETLDLLTEVYKIDVCTIFLRHRIDDYNSYNEIKNLIEFKLLDLNSIDLSPELKRLDSLIANTEDNVYKNIFKQLKFMCLGIIENINSNSDTAYDYFIKSLNTTNKNLTINNYQEFYYSDFELRILMQIAIVLKRNKEFDKSIEILNFAYTNIREDITLKNKILLSLASTHEELKQYNKALEYLNIIINNSLDPKTTTFLFSVYFLKGLCEYNLKIDNYKNSIRISLTLCEVYNLKNRFNSILKLSKDLMGQDFQSIFQTSSIFTQNL